MQAHPDPRMVLLYQRAMICQTFPAYKLSDLGRDAPALEIMQALELMALARKALA